MLTPSTNSKTSLILATACLCQLLVVLDISVLNVALPSIDSALGFSSSSLSWVVNGYTLALGGLLLIGGRLADLINHRRAVLLGLGLFAVASLIGALAQDPAQLIVARAAQGVAAAVLAPVSLTTIMLSFPDGDERKRAITIWAMTGGLGAALGVLVGGVLTDALGWRSVLLLNLPIAALAAATALEAIRPIGNVGGPRPDVVGALAVTLGLSLVVYGLIEAPVHGWGSATIVVRLAAGAAVLLGFALWEARGTDRPLLPLGLLRRRTVWMADLIVLCVGSATVTGFYFASLYLQNVLGYSPIEAGASFVPFSVGVIAGSVLAGKVSGRIGVRATLAGGLLLSGVGMALFSNLSPDSTFLSGFLLPSLIASVALGVCMVTNTTMGTSGVEPAQAGLVSGLLNASRQVGGSLGLAILTSVSIAVTNGSGAARLEALSDGYDRAFLIGAAFMVAAAILAAAPPSPAPPSARSAPAPARRSPAAR